VKLLGKGQQKSLKKLNLQYNKDEEEEDDGGDAVLKRSSRLYFDDMNDHKSVSSDDSD